MNSDSKKVWQVMNDLEMITSKICSAREIIDTAAEAIQRNEYEKAETLAMAAYEFLGYYLEEFDAKFKLAWNETVVKQKKKEEDHCMSPWGHSDLEYMFKNPESVSLQCDRDDPSAECQKSWTSFWEESPSQEEKKDKVIKWLLPVEVDYASGEYFVMFPDDLMEATDLEEGDMVEWVDQGNGSYIIRKVSKPLESDEC